MDMAEYEFNSTQNQVIEQVAKKMRFVGIILIILGIFYMLGGLFTLPKGIANIIAAIIYIIIGYWTTKASTSFQLIVNTEGNDITNLMEALGELKKLYKLQYVILIISILIVIIGYLAGIAGNF